MTQQEIFNQVWDWFVVNGNKPSSDDNNKCLYRGPDNTKCAFGVVLPDHLYKKEMENKPARQVFADDQELCDHFSVPRDPLSDSKVNIYHPVVRLVSRLQFIHDSLSDTYQYSKVVNEQKSLSDFQRGMEEEMRNLAADLKLTVPENN